MEKLTDSADLVENNVYTMMKRLLGDYFSPEMRLRIGNNNEFRIARQDANEPMDAHLVRLRSLAKNCNSMNLDM